MVEEYISRVGALPARGPSHSWISQTLDFFLLLMVDNVRYLRDMFCDISQTLEALTNSVAESNQNQYGFLSQQISGQGGHVQSQPVQAQVITN